MRTACPHPIACGAREHDVGSAAAASCRRRGRAGARVLAPPAPVTPAANAARAAFADLEGQVLADLAASGWRPGQVHPTGGYDAVAVTLDAHYPLRAELVYTRGGVTHRGDGPASLRYFAGDGGPSSLRASSSAGAPMLERSTYVVAGKMHRADGPSVEHAQPPWKQMPDGSLSRESRGCDLFHLDGEPVDMIARTAVQRAETLGVWETKEVTHYLAYEAIAGKGATRALVRAGVSGKVAHDCAKAGVEDPKQILAVHAGELPLSWARAGL